MTPALSVVVPTRDRAEVLPDLLACLLGQELDEAALEVVVVDDGSTDGTAAYLDALDDPRIVVVHRPNGGISAARNSGAAVAGGHYLAYVDDDDRPREGWASSLLAATAGEPAVVCCGARYVDEDGVESGRRVPGPLGPAFADATGLFLAGTFIVRRDVVAALGGFAEGLSCSHATELALRLTRWCADRGESVEHVDRPLIDILRRPPERRPEASAEKLLSGTEMLLEAHGATLRLDPEVHADYLGVAGVAAARLGDAALARRHLAAAFRTSPSPRRAGRLAAATVAPVRRRLWAGGR